MLTRSHMLEMKENSTSLMLLWLHCPLRSIFMIEYQHLLSALDFCTPISFSITAENYTFCIAVTTQMSMPFANSDITCMKCIYSLLACYTPKYMTYNNILLVYTASTKYQYEKIDMTDMISVFFFFGFRSFRFDSLICSLDFTLSLHESCKLNHILANPIHIPNRTLNSTQGENCD